MRRQTMQTHGRIACQSLAWRFGWAWIGKRISMAPESALVRMLRAGRPEAAGLDDALDSLARVFGRPAAAKRIGSHVTCAEANYIAWVLVASRHSDAATVWLDEHAASDADEDVHGGPDFDAARYLSGADT